MSVLARELAAVLPPGMTVPAPLAALYDWIEERGLFVDHAGGRVGFLFPEAELKAGWTDAGRPGGTIIEFAAEGSGNLRTWFGHDDPTLGQRLCVFAQSGAEGSSAAFWLDDDGRQRIVHMGSGSGSTLVCVLADDALDFLRLLAIGYDEICWGGFDTPPGADVGPNRPYRDWLVATFGVAVPATGDAIVRTPAFMESKASDDPFWRWAKEQTA